MHDCHHTLVNKWSTSRFELALELAKREQPQGSQGSNGSWLLKEVKPPHAELAISTNASKVLLQLGSKTQAWLRRLPAHFSFETRAKASEHMLWHRCRRMKSDERLFHVHHGQCMANARNSKGRNLGAAPFECQSHHHDRGDESLLRRPGQRKAIRAVFKTLKYQKYHPSILVYERASHKRS